MRFGILTLALIAVCPAEIIDRVAANVGHSVITHTQVVEEIRVQSFIDGVPVDISVDNRRKALDRLVDQMLVRRELEFTRFAPLSEKDVDPLLQSLRVRYPSDAAFNAGLANYGISSAELKSHLSWTVTMLRFVEYRFQPGVQITTSQIDQEYRRQTAEWKQKRTTAVPPLEELQPEIEKIVRQRLVDASLDRWLGEVRTQNDIVYHGDYKL